MKRRDFLKYTTAGMAGLWVGANLPPGAKRGKAHAQPAPDITISITDGMKEMVTHQNPALNRRANIARCYFFIYKEASLPADVPGPLIFTFEGATINISVTNNLDEPHNLAIPALRLDTGPLNPGQNFTGDFVVPAGSAGSYLYYDTMNEPVNRVMGLHGAFIVMPNPANGTPYSVADVVDNPNMAQLFADLGTAAHFPGLAWGEGFLGNAAGPATPPFRQFVWLLHQASPALFEAVGKAAAGVDFSAAEFVDRFLNSNFVPGGKNKPPAVFSDRPQFHTIQGQSGHFSHNTPFVTPHLRVGEPCVIRVLNAGLWMHSMHIHANHVYVMRVTRNVGTTFAPFLQTAFNAFPDLTAQDPNIDVVDNLPWVDTYTAQPLDVWDWLNQYIRPPDIPNELGIGLQSAPLPVDPRPVRSFGVVVTPTRLRPGNTPAGVTTWPPVQELNMAIPRVGTRAGRFPIHVPLSPLCFPMHDHSEPSQTAQGGNYNMGLIAGMNFIGDQNIVGDLQTFPNVPLTFDDPNFTVEANERAVFGPSPADPAEEVARLHPPAGPQPPFEEMM
ncbi:MAG: hypothetical protein FJ134_05240 [Deltaproteobacteria bacterium]|nr:hypothetical protein [Deltaproteobacteria bacterium]